MFRVKRGPDQDEDIARFQNDAGQKLAGVNVNGQFFGDAHLMTGVFLPTLIADTQSAHTTNAAAIQAAIDSSEPGATIKLPNGNFYCDQIKIPAEKPGLTIEGSGQTLIINSIGGDGNNARVFSAFADRVGYIIGVGDYFPGDGGHEFTAVDVFGGDPDGFEEDDVMYFFVPFHAQTADDAYEAQMSLVTEVDGDEITIEDEISILVGATTATATVVSKQVTAINIVARRGGGYYSYFQNNAIVYPRVWITGGGGSDAEAIPRLEDAKLHDFHVTNPGSDYQSAPTVVIDPQNGATATAHINVGTGQVTGITINNPGSGFERSPEITLTGGTSGLQATAVATIGPAQILNFEVTNGGTDYGSVPDVRIDPPPYRAKWIKGGTKVLSVNRQTITIDDPDRVDLYAIDSIVFLCRGPAFDDADGQYFRVLAHGTGGVIHVDQTVRAEDFEEDLTCLVPGPFIEDLTIRNLKIGGLHSAFKGLGAITVYSGFNITIDNVQMVKGDSSLEPDILYFTKTQFVRVGDFDGRIEWQCAHNCTIEDSRITGLVTHSNATDFTISRSRIGGPIRPWYISHRFTFRDCQFALSGPNAQENDDFSPWQDSTDLVLDNCIVFRMGWEWLFKVKRLRMSNVRFLSGTIILTEECKDCVLENVRMETGATLTIQNGSTGRMSNIYPDTGPVTDWFSDTNWLKFAERTADLSAPEGDTAVVYARNISGNKTQLCARFASGAVQPIATEPP